MAKGGTRGAFVGLDLLINTLDSLVETALDQVAVKASAQARKHAKGRLAGQIEIVTPLKGIRAIQPTKAAYYGKWMENGRAGFVPKGTARDSRRRAKVIMFFVNGRQVFTRRVGPETPNPYMRFAAEYLERSGARDLQAAIDKAVAK